MGATTPVEAMIESLGGATPPPPDASAGSPATTDSTEPMLAAAQQQGEAAHLPEAEPRYGPTSLTDLAKRAAARRQVPAEEKSLRGEPDTDEGAEAPGAAGEGIGAPPSASDLAPSTAAPGGLIALDHPQFGRIYVSQQQAQTILSQAFAPRGAPPTSPAASAIATERAQLEGKLKEVEADPNLTEPEREAKLARLETKLLRLDTREQRETHQAQFESARHEALTSAGVAEAEQAISRAADVFDAAKALPDQPEALRKEFASHAYEVVVAQLRNPVNQHLSEAQVVEMVAGQMRRLASSLGLSKRATIKQYVESKRVTSSPGAAPSLRGGAPAPNLGPTPDLRSGLGRAMIGKALEG